MKEWQEVIDTPSSAENPLIYRETLYAIAMLHWQGQGVRQDYKESYDWLIRAAMMEHAGAQAKLGFLYTDGQAVQQDFNQAFEWYSKAAKQGNADGQYNLGICYLYGWGTEPNKTMAAQYLAAASARGDEAAEEALQQVLAEINEGTAPVGGRHAAEGFDAEAHEMNEDSSPENIRAHGALLHDHSWLMSQNPDHFTIQVIALSSLESLKALVEGHENHAPFATYTVERKGRSIYVLTQGNYPNVEEVRHARDYFPKQIQKTDQLWIRQFGMIQDQLANEP